MEQYREKLKVQNLILGICIAALALVSALGFAAEEGLISLIPTDGGSRWQSAWHGFISGASTGVLALMLFGLIRNLLAMKDDKKLKKLYNKVHDERTVQIYTHARSAAMSAFLLLGLAAVLVTGYFSVTVSLTLLACVVACILLSVGFKLYYSLKL